MYPPGNCREAAVLLNYPIQEEGGTHTLLDTLLRTQEDLHNCINKRLVQHDKKFKISQLISIAELEENAS